MKGLSVVITIVLFMLAFALAGYLKRTGNLPADRMAPYAAQDQRTPNTR